MMKDNPNHLNKVNEPISLEEWEKMKNTVYLKNEEKALEQGAIMWNDMPVTHEDLVKAIEKVKEVLVSTDSCLIGFLGKDYGGPTLSFIPNNSYVKYTITGDFMQELKRLILEDSNE